ncbi:MAG: YqaJ viral recombinase family protein, partial [Pseudomonadota bacterium]
MDRQEWLKWRKGGIGSSDAPIIMGASPYKTRLQLYKEKISPEIKEETSFIQQMGNDIEPRLRSYMEFKHDRTYAPKLVVMAEYPHLRASLDGCSEDGQAIIE